MQWYKLDKKQAEEVIDKVASSNQAGLFPPGLTEVKMSELSFYRSYKLYRLINLATLPTFTMDFLSDGKTFIYLDGSKNSLDFIDPEKELRLNERNIVEYVNFYYDQVYNEDGDIYIITDPTDLPFMSSLDDSQRNNILKHHRAIDVSLGASGNYTIKTTMFYEGGLVEGVIKLDPNTGEPVIIERHMLLNDAVHAYWNQGYLSWEH